MCLADRPPEGGGEAQCHNLRHRFLKPGPGGERTFRVRHGYHRTADVRAVQHSCRLELAQLPKDGAAMSQEYRGVPVEAWGRTVPMEFPDSSRPDISAWLACNPHRFNLGRVGFILMKEDGSAAVEEDLEDAVQNVDLWSGIVTSRFCLEGKPVEVKTACHPDRTLSPWMSVPSARRRTASCISRFSVCRR